MAVAKKPVAKKVATKPVVKEVEVIEEVTTYEDTITEDIKKEETLEKVEPKIYKNMDIGGTMVRVSDYVVINALPAEKNPFEVISNEEVKGRDGKCYGIDILQKHSFKVVSDQTKPPKVANQGLIKLVRMNSVLPSDGRPEVRDSEIQFVN